MPLPFQTGGEREALFSIAFSAIEALEELVQRASLVTVRQLGGQLHGADIQQWLNALSQTSTDVQRLRAAMPARAITEAPTSAGLERALGSTLERLATSGSDWQRFVARADAPKLEDFDSIANHAAAMALFIFDARYDELRAAAAPHASPHVGASSDEKDVD